MKRLKRFKTFESANHEYVYDLYKELKRLYKVLGSSAYENFDDEMDLREVYNKINFDDIYDLKDFLDKLISIDNSYMVEYFINVFVEYLLENDLISEYEADIVNP
jgi:hypothetical protein